ncbi:Transposon Ty3-I Gag-Pol polyprotein, partial [Aphis craccivora]
DFAKIASPLTNLAKKENTFIWGNEQEISFETLKKAKTTTPVMAHFKDGYPVFVTTDASLEIDLEIKHRPGLWNTVADCLSRYPVYTTKITDILYKEEINANSTNLEINYDNIKHNKKPMQRLTFDYLGPFPTSRGKKYLIVATCNATKMAFAKAVTNANGAATISFLMDLITSYGVPKYFCSDRDTHFKNKG